MFRHSELPGIIILAFCLSVVCTVASADQATLTRLSPAEMVEVSGQGYMCCNKGAPVVLPQCRATDCVESYDPVFWCVFSERRLPQPGVKVCDFCWNPLMNCEDDLRSDCANLVYYTSDNCADGTVCEEGPIPIYEIWCCAK